LQQLLVDFDFNYFQILYILSLCIQDRSKEVYTDVFPKIVVIDQNDEIPQFAGADPLTTYIEASVLENLVIGSTLKLFSYQHILPCDWFNSKTLFLLTYPA
jgi:hypothetical protein